MVCLFKSRRSRAFFCHKWESYKNEKKMSTENPTEAPLVDYDEADEVTVNEAPIQEEEDADARK